MRRLFYLVLFLVVAVIGLGFAVVNAEPVQFDYYLGTFEAPLALLLTSALIIGALLGAVVGLGLFFRARREVSRLRRTAELKEQELVNLRNIPLKDSH